MRARPRTGSMSIVIMTNSLLVGWSIPGVVNAPCRTPASADVMAITKWSIACGQQNRAPGGLSGANGNKSLRLPHGFEPPAPCSKCGSLPLDGEAIWSDLGDSNPCHPA